MIVLAQICRRFKVNETEWRLVVMLRRERVCALFGAKNEGRGNGSREYNIRGK